MFFKTEGRNMKRVSSLVQSNFHSSLYDSDGINILKGRRRE